MGSIDRKRVGALGAVGAERTMLRASPTSPNPYIESKATDVGLTRFLKNWLASLGFTGIDALISIIAAKISTTACRNVCAWCVCCVLSCLVCDVRV